MSTTVTGSATVGGIQYTPTAAVELPVGDPRGSLFDRTDLVFGSQIGAWDENGGLLASNPTARANAAAAGIRLVRWQMWRTPCDLRGTACQASNDFNNALDVIQEIGAVPLIGLPPIWNEQYPGQPDPWSVVWQQWVVQHAATKGVTLFEMGNEPDNYGGLTGQQYFDQLWVNVPVLKKWARDLGYEIHIGGPAWANSYGGNLADIETWLGNCKAAYLANGNDRDWLPDFVSTHTYLTDAENTSQTAAAARIASWGAFYDDLRTWINGTFAGLSDRGYPIAQQIKLVDSEWNWTINNSNTQQTSQAWADFYYPAMFDMLRAPGVDGAQRVWASCQFTIASHGGGALDLLSTTGEAKPAYTSYQSAATSVPFQQ